MTKTNRYIVYAALALVGYTLLQRQGGTPSGGYPGQPSARPAVYDATLGVPITTIPMADARDYGGDIGAFYA